VSYITCFSDASLCDRSRACGWGGWAIRQEWPRGQFYGGPVLRDINNPNEAELSAMVSLLIAIDAQQGLDGARTIMLQSDSLATLAAVHALLPKTDWAPSDHARDATKLPERRRFSPIERHLAEELTTLVGNRWLSLRHVKGHAETGTGRSWVNAQCDAEARRWMEKQRQGARMSVASSRRAQERTDKARQWVESN
jgi:ribonuclease HI